MKNKALSAALCLCLVLLISAALCVSASAYDGEGIVYSNPETGYKAVILDEYDLLTDIEENALVEYMAPITDYGDVMFWSTNEYAYDEIEQAKRKRYSIFGYESSAILAINMNVRMITFQSDGAIYYVISESYARSITDNVSGYASQGDYYRCAAASYVQAEQLLEGNKISEPMKYTSYAFIALMLAFVIVVGIAFGKLFNPLAKQNDRQGWLSGTGYLLAEPPKLKVTNSYMRAWWQVLFIILTSFGSGGGGSDSGGSSSGGSSSGGGGGGGFSGGGGGGGSSRF